MQGGRYQPDLLLGVQQGMAGLEQAPHAVGGEVVFARVQAFPGKAASSSILVCVTTKATH